MNRAKFGKNVIGTAYAALALAGLWALLGELLLVLFAFMAFGYLFVMIQLAIAEIVFRLLFGKKYLRHILNPMWFPILYSYGLLEETENA
jgi:uncharacterized membrane protein